MLAIKAICLKCPRGQPYYISYSATWYCSDPENFREFTVLRDQFPLLAAETWCPLVKENKYKENNMIYHYMSDGEMLLAFKRMISERKVDKASMEMFINRFEQIAGHNYEMEQIIDNNPLPEIKEETDDANKSWYLQ